MTGDAVTSPEVSMVRREVPEFERAFQWEPNEERGEMGPFQAMSLLADWVAERLASAPDDDAARRAFDSVEKLITDHEYHLGDALAAEFIEGIWHLPQAGPLMGPGTRQRARGGR